MLRVLDQTFENFGDVVQWAWNTHKIDYHGLIDTLLFEEQQIACHELELAIIGEVRCHRCDSPASKVQAVDPLLAEYYDEIVQKNYCDECWDRRCLECREKDMAIVWEEDL